MREIKFRAWHKKNKKMYMVDELFFGLKGEGVVEVWLGDEKRDRCIVASFDEVELIQFTGLKDKNGKEIYEGDIVAAKFHPHYTERISWRGEPDAICRVIWDLAGFRLKARGKDDTRYCDFFDLSLKHSEIIGNIYENPELLKEPKKER